MKKIISILALIILLSSCGTDYGKKLQLGRAELYYTSKISEDEASRLGKFLQDNAMASSDNKVSYQIDKEANSYVFKLILADEKYTKNKEYTDNAQIIAGFMAKDVFNNSPVDFWLCNDKFEPLLKLPYKVLPDSIIEKARQEDLLNGQPDGMPKDNVSPVDTALGMPA